MTCGSNNKTGEETGPTKAISAQRASAAALKWVKDFKCPRSCGIRAETSTTLGPTRLVRGQRADRSITGKLVFTYSTSWSARVVCEHLPYISLPESVVSKLIADGTLTKRF